MSTFTESPPLSPSWTYTFADSRASASTSSGVQSREVPFPASQGSSGIVNGSAVPRSAGHQRFVLADPVAFSYLEEDRDTTVLERSRKLVGYQCYIVEQWICSRTHPTFVIITYTGEETHSIKVGVISVPADERKWSTRLSIYFKSLREYSAKPKDTPLGTVMLTSLSAFPSSLTLVAVPEGDVRKNREYFLANEDLKRLCCAGRVGLTLAEPTPPTQAKFQHLYKTSHKIPFMSSVIELIKLCQTALTLYNCLEADYVDGLLCDFTEKAVKDWWTRIGFDLYDVEPVDGILGPTSVAAILGTLIGARNRLHALGFAVSKDVFDVDTTKTAIGSFQKSQRITKTRRLDGTTLDRLHRATAKQASSEGWAVPKAVKSTVADLSGKGGEMVMDIVGRREKHNISDIETIDIERFAELVKGERTKWLWHGKARRRTNDAARDMMPSHSRTKSERIVRSSNEINSDVTLDPVQELESSLERPDSRRSEIRQGMDANMRDNIFRRAKGRIRDAVGLRGHQYGQSRDSNFLSVQDDKSVGYSSEEDAQSPIENTSPGANNTASKTKSTDKPDQYLQAAPPLAKEKGAHKSSLQLQTTPSFTKALTETPIDTHSRSRLSVVASDSPSTFALPTISLTRDDSTQGKIEPTEPLVSKIDLSEMAEQWGKINALHPSRPVQSIGHLLRRVQSYSKLEEKAIECHNDNKWPRHLSFSAAEGTVLELGRKFTLTDDWPGLSMTPSPRIDLIRESLRTEETRQLRERIAQLDSTVAEWVEMKIAEVQGLDEDAAQQVTQLNDLYVPRRDEFHVLEEWSEEIVSREKSQLQEGLKDIEVLGAKLEYDISTLKGKVEEVEDAVDEFQKQVEYTESRVQDLLRQSEKESWSSWVHRVPFNLRK